MKGMRGDTATMAPPMSRFTATLKNKSLRTVSLAPWMSPAPSSWPERMPMALPMAAMTMANKFHTVELMLVAATAVRPRVA